MLNAVTSRLGQVYHQVNLAIGVVTHAISEAQFVGETIVTPIPTNPHLNQIEMDQQSFAAYLELYGQPSGQTSGQRGSHSLGRLAFWNREPVNATVPKQESSREIRVKAISPYWEILNTPSLPASVKNFALEQIETLFLKSDQDDNGQTFSTQDYADVLRHAALNIRNSSVNEFAIQLLSDETKYVEARCSLFAVALLHPSLKIRRLAFAQMMEAIAKWGAFDVSFEGTFKKISDYVISSQDEATYELYENAIAAHRMKSGYRTGRLVQENETRVRLAFENWKIRKEKSAEQAILFGL